MFGHSPASDAAAYTPLKADIRRESAFVKVFGCRPPDGGAARTEPAYANLQGRKPREGIRGWYGVRYGDLSTADRQLARLVNDVGVLDDLVAFERDPKEEPQRRDGLVDGRHANTARRQMQLVAAYVLEARHIG